MKPLNLIATTTFGGACTAAAFGNLEAIWLLNTTGAPELVSLVYSVLLYGLIGGGIAFGASIGLTVLFKIVPSLQKLERFAFGIGGAAAIIPMGAFVLRYQLNKVVYAEQGVPMTTMLGILAGLFLLSGLLLLICKWMEFTAKKGALIWIEMLIFMGAISATSLSGGNPAAEAHNKNLPDTLQDKPNVLMLMIDTLRADYVGAYNQVDINTPNLDGLASDGILFEKCISQASWTRPSGVSIFTGRIPSGHATQTKAARVPDEATLFSEILQNNGVTTGALANNINLTSTFNLDQGFDTFMYEAPNYPFAGTESVFGLTFYKVVAKVKERLSPEHRVVHDYYQPADVVFEDVKAFIESNDDNRWMMYAHVMEPHDPYFEHPSLSGSGPEYNGVGYGRAEHEHPDPNDTEYLKDVYKQEIEFLDLEIGRMVSWLKESNRYENTVIIVVSDHGEEFNEHGGFWHGTTLYDEVLHVPLIVKTAQNARKGIRIPWQVRSIDIAPTITDLMGLEADPSWDGESLLPDLSEVDEAHTTTQCTPHPMARIAISENDFEGNILSAIRMNGWKYILANPDNPRGLQPEELYALIDDPKELTNKAAEKSNWCDLPNGELKDQMKAILGEILKEAQSSAAQSNSGELDAATIERMRKLGYME